MKFDRQTEMLAALAVTLPPCSAAYVHREADDQERESTKYLVDAKDLRQQALRREVPVPERRDRDAADMQRLPASLQ